VQREHGSTSARHRDLVTRDEGLDLVGPVAWHGEDEGLEQETLCLPKVMSGTSGSLFALGWRDRGMLDG
jgi:hypothetical protein